MLKMLIVEDEKWEREGLIDFLDWPALGIELCGLACDGIDGLEKARMFMPDIIITDIKMPGLDGLKMSSEIREFIPDTKIIILTGYDDFKLAQEAININANAYILKPVEEEELLKVLQEVISRCEKDASRTEQERKLLMLINEKAELARNEMLLELLKDKAATGVLEKAKMEGILPQNCRYTVIAVKCFQAETDSDSDGKSDIKSKNIEGVFRDDCYGVVSVELIYEAEKLVYLIVSREKTISEDLQAIKAASEKVLCENETFDAFAGIGIGTDDPGQLYISCRQAAEALDYSVFWGDKKVCVYSELEAIVQYYSYSTGEFLSRGNYYIKQLMHSVRAADNERIDQLLSEMFEFIDKCRWAGREMIVNFLFGLLNETSLLFYSPAQTNIDESAAGSPLLSMNDFAAIKQYICTFYNSVVQRIQQKMNNKDENIVQKVEQIIMERYCSDLSIKTIAAEVYLSPNYLGNIFKKCTGRSLNDFICQFRMEKAKELLQSPKCRVSKVAAQIGIPNTSYFCMLFKETYGIAPGEYQEMIKHGGL